VSSHRFLPLSIVPCESQTGEERGREVGQLIDQTEKMRFFSEVHEEAQETDETPIYLTDEEPRKEEELS
jgi:hypothetical protein